MLSHALLILTFAAASPPFQPAPPEQQAEQLLQEALALRAAHRPEEALAKLERAEELAPSPKLAANRGLVEAALERWISAEQHLASALASQDAWVARHRDSLSTVLTRVLDHVAQVTVTGLPGTDVNIGDQHVTLPMKTPVPALEGTLAVRGTLKGFYPTTKVVFVQPGVPITIALAQVPEPVAVAPRPKVLPPVGPGGSSAHDLSPRTWPIWASAATAAVGIAAIGMGAWQVHRDGEPTCGTLPDGARCGVVYDTATSGWVAIGAGAAALSGAGALLWLGLREHDGSSLSMVPGGIAGTF